MSHRNTQPSHHPDTDSACCRSHTTTPCCDIQRTSKGIRQTNKPVAGEHKTPMGPGMGAVFRHDPNTTASPGYLRGYARCKQWFAPPHCHQRPNV